MGSSNEWRSLSKQSLFFVLMDFNNAGAIHGFFANLASFRVTDLCGACLFKSILKDVNKGSKLLINTDV